MAYPVLTLSAESVAANAKEGDFVSGRNQYVTKGRLQVFAKASATGLNLTVNVGGVALIDDQVIPFTGTAGTLDVNANGMVDQIVGGGRVECFLRNTTGAAITADVQILWTPTK